MLLITFKLCGWIPDHLFSSSKMLPNDCRCTFECTCSRILVRTRERRIPRHHHHRHAHRRCILFRPSVHAESNYKSQSEEYRVNYRCAGHCKMDINPSEMKVPVAIEEDRQHVSHSFKPATLTLLLLLRLCC